jgi:isoquinoline 1-oxidoreductase alpha subunit
MTSIGWSFVEVAARLLEGDEREAVLGDLLEAEEAGLQGALDVFGLAIRRQLALWTGIARQLAPDGIFPFCQPDLSTAHPPSHLQGDRADRGPGFHVALVQCLPVDRLVLDRWLCHGIDLAPDRAGKCRHFLSALHILPGEISRGVALAVLPPSLFAPRNLGSLLRPADRPDQNEIGTDSGGGHHPPHDSHLGQQRLMDSQLGVELAGMVHGGDGMERPRDEGAGKMADPLSLSVNGVQHPVSASPDTPLLYVLRNELRLSGPRLGCGIAQCGACAVLVDGAEVRSCIAPLSSAVGKQVTTIEGLPQVWAKKKGLSESVGARTLHPVQQAWIDEQVPQCGYCQSGMIIAAVELLDKNPNPTVVQIKDAFTNKPPSPHLCRCGTYAAIIEAVQLAAKTMSA